MRGDIDNASVIVGEATGLIHDILPAGEIVQGIVTQAAELMRTADGYLES